MFTVALLFYPNQANPARACGRGTWRVKACWPTLKSQTPHINRGPGGSKRLIVTAGRSFKVGSRVDPANMLFTREQRLAA